MQRQVFFCIFAFTFAECSVCPPAGYVEQAETYAEICTFPLKNKKKNTFRVRLSIRNVFPTIRCSSARLF